MPDAVARMSERKAALDLARAAMRTGARSEMEAALSCLPPTGKKADRLRKQLISALEQDQRRTDNDTEKNGPALAVCFCDGISYYFRVAETGEIAFFNVQRQGARVMVTINSEHPFGIHLMNLETWKDPTLLSLLAGWAHYELDQNDARRQSAISESRVDWGRVVRRVLHSGGGLKLGG